MSNVNEVKLSRNALAKREMVAEIAEKIRSAQSVIVLSSSGVTVAEITALRNRFREAGVEYKVLKNTLVQRAMEELEISSLDSILEGPSAFAFGIEDAVAPAKIICDYMAEQKANNKFTIKAGLVEGTYMSPAAVEALAKLPSRDVLIAKAMGSLNAPITNFVGVLSATLRSFVYAVDAVRKQKEAE